MMLQEIITSDLTTDEKAVLLAFMLDQRGYGAFRWKAIGEFTGHRKTDVLAIRDDLVARGYLRPSGETYFGDGYDIIFPPSDRNGSV